MLFYLVSAKSFVLKDSYLRIRKERVLKGFLMKRTLVFMRLTQHTLHLKELKEHVVDRKICLARTYEKFEELKWGSVDSLIGSMKENNPRGEFVIVIEGIGK